MIQKKTLKEAIQNPEIISVVGGLIGKTSQTKDGLMPSKLAAIECYLTGENNVIEISLDQLYRTEIYNVTVYRDSNNCLYQCVFSPYNPAASSVKYIGAPVPNHKMYIDKLEKKIYIDFSGYSRLRAFIIPMCVHNAITSVNLIPKESFTTEGKNEINISVVG